MTLESSGDISITISGSDDGRKIVFESPHVEELEIANDVLRIYFDPELAGYHVREYSVKQIDHLATSTGDGDGIHWTGYLHRNMDGDSHLPETEEKKSEKR